MGTMMSEMDWSVRAVVRDGRRGLVIRVFSVARPYEKLCRNKREYYNKFMTGLRNAGRHEFVDLVIDSGGGAVHSAMGMVAALGVEGWKGKTTRILIDGQCGSAATLLLKLQAPVYITEGGSVFVHMPSSVRLQKAKSGEYVKVGTPTRAMDTTARMLEGACVHRMKRNGKRSRKGEVRGLMEQAHRFTAKEAVAFGLCDGFMRREAFEKG